MLKELAGGEEGIEKGWWDPLFWENFDTGIDPEDIVEVLGIAATLFWQDVEEGWLGVFRLKDDTFVRIRAWGASRKINGLYHEMYGCEVHRERRLEGIYCGLLPSERERLDFQYPERESPGLRRVQEVAEEHQTLSSPVAG